MEVKVSGRHIAVSDAVRQYCEQKAEKLVRFFDRIQSIEVVLDGNAGRHTAKMIVHAEHHDPFVAEETNADLYAAIDELQEEIEEQLRRHKEKLRNRKHPE